MALEPVVSIKDNRIALNSPALDSIGDYLHRLATWFDAERGDLMLFSGVLLASIAIAAAVLFVIKFIVRQMAARQKGAMFCLFLSKLSLAATLFIVGTSALAGLVLLDLDPRVIRVLHRLYALLMALAVINALTAVIDAFCQGLASMAKRTESKLDDLLADLIKRISKPALWILGAFFIAQNIFKLNISAILASAGVLGLAIAFAAQNTIANIFGAISIILDKPFEVGERINLGGKDGIVEAVGLRSTKLRSLDGTLWTVPNKELAEASIQNFTKRPNFKHIFDVALVYNTTPAQMRQALAIMHDILDQHPLFDMEKLPPRIHFAEMKDWSLNIQAIVWFQTTDFFGKLDAQEKINFEILERFNAAGLEFAFPSQTTYVAGDPVRPLQLQPPPSESKPG